METNPEANEKKRSIEFLENFTAFTKTWRPKVKSSLINYTAFFKAAKTKKDRVPKDLK